MNIQKMLYGSGRNLVILVGEEEAEPIAAKLEDCALLSLSGFDWNDMLSPWPAEKIFKKGADFGGNADELVTVLETEIVPQVREQLDPERLIIAGYSLAGLFSLYAATKTDVFDACASVSGSLWYPGFDAYLKDHPVHCGKIYLSLGDAEKKTKNPVMSQVEAKTREAADLLSAGAEVIFEMNPGGHFNEPDKRIIKAIKALTE
ncbi:MAG: hypothetical protein IJH44_01100 [Solobacterium sp.]|nr:hypothetical protein [Solobacterium sp.]